MSVAICIRMMADVPATLEAVMVALVDHNLALYQAGAVEGEPFGLKWDPDQLIVCDAEGQCAIVDTSVLHDAAILADRGYGSCGELACAYAAWMRYNGKSAGVELIRTGAGTYHAVAFDEQQTYDPQAIGGGQNATHA